MNHLVPADYGIKAYKHVTTLQNWDQERYIACIRIAELYLANRFTDDAIFYFLESRKHDPERIEGVARAAQLLITKKKYSMAHNIIMQNKYYSKTFRQSKLYIDMEQYKSVIEYLGTITCFHTNEMTQGFKFALTVLSDTQCPINIRAATLCNLPLFERQLALHVQKSKNNLLSLLDTAYSVFKTFGSLLAQVPPRLFQAWNILETMALPILCAPTTLTAKPKTKKKPTPQIVLTMTTCKRLDLFTKTMRSILNTWQDAHLVDEWIIIDDNSSQEDVQSMRREFKFIRIIQKTPEQRGHRHSMNIIFKELERL
jgi:hypothetical protein